MLETIQEFLFVLVGCCLVVYIIADAKLKNRPKVLNELQLKMKIPHIMHPGTQLEARVLNEYGLKLHRYKWGSLWAVGGIMVVFFIAEWLSRLS